MINLLQLSLTSHKFSALSVQSDPPKRRSGTLRSYLSRPDTHKHKPHDHWIYSHARAAADALQIRWQHRVMFAPSSILNQIMWL